jgi:hypothetical protein
MPAPVHCAAAARELVLLLERNLAAQAYNLAAVLCVHLAQQQRRRQQALPCGPMKQQQALPCGRTL